MFHIIDIIRLLRSGWASSTPEITIKNIFYKPQIVIALILRVGCADISTFMSDVPIEKILFPKFFP